MSFFRQVVAEFSGLNAIDHSVDSNDIPAVVDACYRSGDSLLNCV